MAQNDASERAAGSVPTTIPAMPMSGGPPPGIETPFLTLADRLRHTGVGPTNDRLEPTMPSITPFLWFDSDLAEPIAFYTSIFPDDTAPDVRHADDHGPIFSATIELCGQQFLLLNGGPAHAGFTEAISLFVTVETQGEIDDLWARLTEDGGEPSRCGWLKDRYGLSWQIVPDVLGSLLGSPDRKRAQQATDAMLEMDKLDIAALQAAYDR